MIGTQPDDSLTSVEEHELVRHLIGDWHWGEPVLRMMCSEAGTQFLQNRDLGTLGEEGDIDVLCIPPSQPERAVAVQVKLVKVGAHAFATLQPSRLAKIRDAFKQANRTQALCFSRVLCCIIVLVDQRELSSEKSTYCGITAELNAEIDRFVLAGGLHSDVGLLQVHLVQSPGQAPLTTGEISCEMRRWAPQRVQRNSTTDWVVNQLKTSSFNR